MIRQKHQVLLGELFIRSFYVILLLIKPGEKLWILLILCITIVEKIHFFRTSGKIAGKNVMHSGEPGGHRRKYSFQEFNR